MKKDNYHIQIKPEFLFDEYEVFESNYTPWVYLSIKHKYNYYLDNAPNKLFTIDKHALAGYYATTPATIYKAIKELKAIGLLEEKKRKYKIIDENEYLRKFRKVDEVNENKYPDFIKVYNNAYDDLLLDIKKEILPIGSNKRLIVKCLKLYFYLMSHNRHCIVSGTEPVLDSGLTQTSLETYTGMDHRVIKFLLSVLNDKGYIKMEESKIYTLNKDTYNPNIHLYQKPNENSGSEYNSEPVVSIMKAERNNTVQENACEEKSVPESFIGYSKSSDGKTIFVIYYSKKLRSITVIGWCKGDGIPQTSEEFDISNDLKSNGKKSIYYNPESFWLYKQENLAA